MGDKYYSNFKIIIFIYVILLCNKIQGTLTITSQESIGLIRIVLPYQHIDTEERL